jgi:dinuclear metal center YbgI/SA1388 family protein
MHANASLDGIVAYLDRLLEVEKFASEEASNGLLLRGSEGVSKFAVAVNTSLVTILGAAKGGAQLLVVHHPPWQGIDLHLYEEKMAAMQAAGVSLYAAHHALDCAPGFGNAWALAGLLEISLEQTFGKLDEGIPAGVIGVSADSFSSFVQRASRALGVEVEAHQHAKSFGRVAILPGAGLWTSWMDEARRLGADTYVTGEGSMYTRMFAREAGMNLILGTHHATEVAGIKALGEKIAAEAQIPWEFIADSADVF